MGRAGGRMQNVICGIEREIAAEFHKCSFFEGMKMKQDKQVQPPSIPEGSLILKVF
jgi:hypothetical protein